MSLLENSTGSPEAGSIYSPLSTKRNEIRLLTLKAGSGKTPIEGSLTTVCLDDLDCPSYNALSYTWGTTENPGNIIIGGRELRVTPNLHVALEHFRKTHEDLCLWIDAICVNQLNLEERGEQVLLMRDIYSRAENTIVWLGSEADDSAKAMDLIDLLNYINDDYTSRQAESKSQSDPNIWGSQQSWKIEEEITALTALLQRPWFFRIWVVQEAVLSKNLIIHCGDQQTTWKSLNGVVSFFAVMAIHFSKFDAWAGLNRIFDISTTLNDYRHRGEENEQGKDMLVLLTTHREAKATDPRDKCIALLGLAKKGYKRDSANLYSQSVQEIYTSTMAAIACQATEWPLTFLLYSGLLRGRADLPSWVPDWTYSSFAGDAISGWQVEAPVLANNPSIPYDIIKGLQLDVKLFQFLDNDSTLHASGVAFDAIRTYTATNSSGAGDTLPERESRANDCSKQYDHQFSGYPTGEAIADVLWRTLVLDRIWENGKIPPDEWKWVVYWILREENRHQADIKWQNQSQDTSVRGFTTVVWEAFQTLKFAGTTFGDVVQEQIPNFPDGFLPLNTEIHLVDSNIASATGGRRMAVSDKGYLGLVPTWTDEDDIIAILFGCPVPVILRKHDGWYEFIGTCYFHGIMEGELVPGIQNGEYETQSFEMR